MNRSNLKGLLLLCALLLAVVTAGAQERVYRVGYLSWQDAGAYYDVTLRGFSKACAARVSSRARTCNCCGARHRTTPIASSRWPTIWRGTGRPVLRARHADGHRGLVCRQKTPIVVATIMDPVELKFVKSLARPGTRVTGVTTMNNELTVKRLQLLMETVPGLKRVGVVIDEAMRDACTQEMDHALVAAKQLGLTLVAVHIDRPELLDAGFKKLVDAKVQAVTSTLLSTRNNLEPEYAQAALKYKLPSMFEQDIGARVGGLMSYGPDFEDIFRRAGRYAGRVLKAATLPRWRWRNRASFALCST